MKRNTKIVSIFLTIIFMLMFILFIVYSFIFLSSEVDRLGIADRYREKFDIEFETPETLERIFTEGLRDINYLNRLTYDEETYQKMLEYDYVLPINKKDVQKLIDKEIMHLIEKKENVKIFEKISSIIIENENNYYTYLGKPGFYYELFLYDVDEYKLYILTLVF